MRPSNSRAAAAAAAAGWGETYKEAFPAFIVSKVLSETFSRSLFSLQNFELEAMKKGNEP